MSQWLIKKKKHYRDVCKFGIAGNFYFQFRISFRVIAIFRRDSKDESYIHVFTQGFLSTFDLEQGAKLHRYY